MTGTPTDKDKVIELQDKLIDAQSQIVEKDRQIAELVDNCNALAEEVTRLGKPNEAHKELVEVIDTQKAQMEKLMGYCEALVKEVQRLKQPVRASTDHDKIRKKGKFDGRDKRWEEALKEESGELTKQDESKTKRTKRNPSKGSTLDQMLKKRRG